MADKNLFLGNGPKKPDLRHDKKDMSFTNHMSAQFGKIYPCFLMEMNGNEHLSIRPRAEFDLMPMVFPLQSNITMHLSFFKCALRNLWKGYRDWIGGIGQHKYPYISRSSMFHHTRSLADYMGIPSYSNVPSIDWHSLQLFTNSDDSVQRLRRGYFLANQEFSPRFLRNDSYVYASHDSLFSFFASQSTDGDAVGLPCQIQSQLIMPISESQPYIQFYVYSLSSSVPTSFKQLNYSFVYYEKSDSAASSPYYACIRPFSMMIKPQVSSPAALNEDEFALLSTEQVTFQSQSVAYKHTFVAHLNSIYVNQANSIIENSKVLRPFFFWDSSDDGFLGINENLYRYVVGPQNPFGVINRTNLSNATLVPASTYQYFSSGLQGSVLFRVQTSKNVTPSDSPFISVNGESPRLPLSVLPFRMYEFIYNLYFRNTQVDPFIKNGQPTYNEYLTYDGDGADSLTPVDFKFALYEPDFFTTAKYTPQAGNAPLVGISHMPNAGNAVFHMRDQNNNVYTMTVETDSEDNITGISGYSGNANESSLANLKELISYGISINDFRSVAAYQRFLERKQRAGFDYKSFEKEFFGVNAPIGEEFPQYIGGLSQPVSIFKLENQSATDMPLGYFAGTGRVSGFLGEHESSISCFADERCLVMGLIWFSVTPVYPQKLDKFWIKCEPLDFFNPQFATIGNQPIHNYELAPLQATDDDNLKSVFGYQRPWYEYVMKTDEVHGEFRDTLHNYLLQREFATIPELGHDFISISPDDLTNVFSYQQGTDKMFGAIRFNVAYNSIVPDFILPSIVG